MKDIKFSGFKNQSDDKETDASLELEREVDDVFTEADIVHEGDVDFFVKADGSEDFQDDVTDYSALDGELVSMSEKNGEGQAAGADASGTALSTVESGSLQEAENQRADGPGIGKGRMGERMVAMGLITEDQLNVGLQEKKISGKMLGEILVELGFIEEDTLTLFLAESSGFGVFDPRNTIVDGEALAVLNKNVALEHQILPISLAEDSIYVAMSDPYDVVALDTLRRFLPSKSIQIKPMVTTASILSDAIDASYGYASSIGDILAELEEGKEQKEVASLNEKEAFMHPIVRLVNALVFEAVKIGASDLHFEPEESFVRLRYRLDGVLFTAQILHKQHWNGISQRLKIMSEMNIADKFSPQDGRFNLNIGGREADFRVSSLPTVHGENIVLRVLDKSESIMPMEALGFSEENLEKLKKATSKPEGIIIVTGPTGSGKSTSLYSILNEINDVEVNIQTLEDPVEYSLPMIRQTHVREGILEFADGIKALLRQDPDIIFIGEIRDHVTAEMALKAAMTGHQVYTSLHTNDSFGALPRLLDLGLKPGMLAGAIIAVFAQRLARRLCKSCRQEYKPDAQECEILGVDAAAPPTIYKAKSGGCSMCKNTGYKGRIALVEILLFDDELDELVARNESKAEIRALALKKGFKNMKDDGILKVLEGTTDLSAISKVVDIGR
ncbi:MAG: GspE/PulE family protein [Alphaproteobacteria bacterium]